MFSGLRAAHVRTAVGRAVIKMSTYAGGRPVELELALQCSHVTVDRPMRSSELPYAGVFFSGSNHHAAGGLN